MNNYKLQVESYFSNNETILTFQLVVITDCHVFKFM